MVLIGKPEKTKKVTVEQDFRSTQTIENLLTPGVWLTETNAQEDQALNINNYRNNVLTSEADGPD